MARDSARTAMTAAASSRGRRRGRSTTIRRLLTGLAFLPIASRAPLYARLVWVLLRDARTPAPRKAMLAGAVGYVLLGRDVVPDRVPLLGSLDDVVVVALALDVFFAGIDDVTLEEKLAELGIARAAYDEDVARIRRLLPGPLRRTIHRLPRALALVGQAIARNSRSREGSIA
jgi:uncharacterized membrane protein YkvA (DUF1232 family)